MASAADPRLTADNPPAPPFDSTRDTRYFFPSAGHAEALSRLTFLADDRNMGMGLLTGEIGSGKTLLRTVLHAHLSPQSHVRVSIENGLLDFDDLLLEILSQIQAQRLRAADYPDRYTRLAAFKRLLTEQIVGRDRHLVILLDEAQQLDTRCLDAIKGLTNISSERQNYLTVILIGQPELRGHLRQIPQVDQRVSLRFHLTALTADETREYVRHRLNVAGYSGAFPFDDEALDILFRASRGIPREVNRICKIALEYVLAEQLGRFTAPAIATVVDDLRRQGGLFDAAVDPQ
jgi:general secretion pathway protein A